MMDYLKLEPSAVVAWYNDVSALGKFGFCSTIYSTHKW